MKKINVIKTIARKNIKFVIDVFKCLGKRLPLRLLFLCDVDIDSIPYSTKISHPYGICINKGVVIGQNCDIRHGATIGNKSTNNRIIEHAVIGDNVFIGCNASILGNVRVGNGAVIGAHALVLKDVPAYTIVKGVWK
jgi:serine acetyltransferase